MRNITVLVTASGAQFMPGLAVCLKNNGERSIKIIGTDMGNDSTIKQIIDEVYSVPSVSNLKYIDILLDICKKESVDVLIPFMSAELTLIKERKNEFEAIGTKISVSNNKAIDIANNKLKLYQYMKDNGLSAPNFYPLRKVVELEEVCQKLGYPQNAVCIKSTQSSGSRGIRIIDPSKSRFDILFNEKPNSFYISLEELKHILNEKPEMPEMMAMEYLPGEEYSVDLLADNGKVIYIAGRESNVILASIPQEATLIRNEEAYKISCDVIEKLELDGNADLDFKFDKNGNPVLMEINPRIAATMQIFYEGGLNLPYLRIKQLLGEKMPNVEVNYGVKMKRRYLEMFSR